MRPLILLCLFILSACAGTTTPTSDRLELVRTQKQQTLETELALANMELGAPVFIRIFKEEGILETWLQNEETKRFKPFKQYDICKFSGFLGPKLHEGDGQAPEGFYEISANQLNPWSRHHLSVNLGYPNKYDRALNRTGSALMIHGGCSSIGCYAITDQSMEDVYLLTEASIANGTPVPVHIFPFKMTPKAMFDQRDSGWLPFWENLREGYDAFELTKIPPKARQHDYKYVFDKQDFKTALY